MFKLGIIDLFLIIGLMIIPVNFVSAQSGNLYVDNDYGFKIKSPQGWTVNENIQFLGGGSGVVSFSDNAGDSEYHSNFHIEYKKNIKYFDEIFSVSEEYLEEEMLSYSDSSNDRKVLDVDVKKFEDRIIINIESIESKSISNSYGGQFIKMKKHGVMYFFDNGARYSLVLNTMPEVYDYVNSDFKRSLQTFVVYGYENSPQRILDTKLNCGIGALEKNGQCVVDPNYATRESLSLVGGGCLIATATYGSEMATEVQQLRELRDNTLLNTASGTQFMAMFNDVYYSFSPIIADMERENSLFKEAVKVGLTPMISSLSLMENAESESEVLGLGLSVIALNLGMYLGVPAVVIVGIRKKF